jgi:hypothetical protein
VLPFTLILLFVFVLAVSGFAGAAAALDARARLQAAADAASLAAASQAHLWEALTVMEPTYACTPTRYGWQCSDGPETAVTVRSFRSRLFAEAGTSPRGQPLPGWAVDAGCAYTFRQNAGDPPAPPTPTAPYSALVCDSWSLVAHAFAFPPGSDPAGAAAAMLQRNVAHLASRGVHVALQDVSLDPTSGRVSLTVRAVEPGNPLALVLGSPVALAVDSGSAPVLTTPLPASGS